MSEPLPIEVTILGCGTSTGVPVLGCTCAVCTSDDSRNKRTRVSCLVEVSGKRILIDTPPDLREQALREGFKTVDAILFTHAHADHVHGIDDTRLLNYNNGYREIPAFASPETAENLLARFGYAFGLSSYPGSPKLHMTGVQEGFTVGGVKIEPVPVPHGPAGTVYGFRIGDFAYITDCNDVPGDAIEKLRGLKALVLDCLRQEPHPTHLHLERSVEIARLIGARRTVFTHISHDLSYADGPELLPEGMEFAYDGLRIEIE